MTEFRPHEYQKRAIRFCLDHKKCGLFLPMGAGKTVTTLTVLDQLVPIDVCKVLIIGPVRVIQSTWPDEIEKWDHTKDMSYSVVAGTPKQREEALQADADIFLIGKENVQWLVDKHGRDWAFDMVVIDELSAFKNPKAQRFKALRKVMPLVDRFIGLTGTPAPRGIPDLWSQIYLMDRGERLGRTLGQFRERYLKPGRRNGYIVYEWKPQDDAEQRIYERIGDICMSLNQKECAELPPVQRLEIPIRMPAMAFDQYRAYKREKVLELNDNDTLIAANAGVLCGQLLQMTSGEIYTKNDNGEITGTQIVHSSKLAALDDLIESANGNPVLVFYYFRHELYRIKKHLQSMKVNVRELVDAKDVNAWNRGHIDVLLAHPASAGHGLNLQKGGHIMVWYTLPNWDLELYQQANARLYRQGQNQNVLIYHLIAKGTIDEDMIMALDRKKVTQQNLIDALRR